ncbi:MAG TPA: branched-chain amino acid ABC transporter ATP-binding protein/permease [Burkholderiaceae bacterium]|nr:branched-chain amino acid ABC transporter ATP-binding protein/permease [Burkholderiaceae bacterium]
MAGMPMTASMAPRAHRSWPGYLAFVLLLAIVPLLVRGEFVLFLGTQIGIYFLVALGLNLLSGYGGQISLGQGALVAIGAYTVAIAMVDYKLSFWLALPLALLLTAGAGALMALPAFRLSTWYFALVTLGFANVVGGLLTEWRGLTHGFAGIVGIPKPALFGHLFTQNQLYWMLLAVSFGAFLAVRNLVASRFGRALLGLHEHPVLVRGVGASLVRLKMQAFVISAALAGLAGAFMAVHKTVITPDDFPTDLSTFFLLVIVLGGMGRLHGALVGTLVFFIVPELLAALHDWRLLIYGSALLLLILFAPGGLAGGLETLARRWARRGGSSHDVAGDEPAAAAATMPPITGAALEVRDVTKRFGGIAALTDVSLELPAGAVHAIVGPNGSGKTTLLNLISGYYPLDAGTIRIAGRRTDRMEAGAIARLGVRRTFQTPKLIAELNVLENVMLGAFSDERSGLAGIALALPSARREAAGRTAEALRYLRFVGLHQRAHDPAGDLPHGQQRLVEIARALLGRPGLLMLDEPAAGLSLSELDGLARLVGEIARLGTTVVIVEHHLELVANLARGVTVLDGGRILASGTPEAVFSDQKVMAAYMGKRALSS